MQFALKHGHTAYSGISYGASSVLFIAILGKYHTALQLAKLSIQLSHRFRNLQSQTKVYFAMAGMVNFWLNPFEQSHAYFDTCVKIGAEGGDMQYSNYALNTLSSIYYVEGKKLPDIETFLVESVKVVESRREKWSEKYMQLSLYFICSLMGKSYSLPEKESFQKEALLQHYYNFFHLKKSFFLEDAPMIRKYAWATYALADSGIGLVQWHEFYFYFALSLFRLYPTESIIEKWRYRMHFRSIRKKFRLWSDNCPQNFLNKYWLIEAEFARITRKTEKAVSLYELAIQDATQNGYIQNAAIGHECLARFYEGVGNTQAAERHLEAACDGFREWGALGKVAQMEARRGIL